MPIVVTPVSSEGALEYLRSAIQARGYGTDTAPDVQNHVLNSVYRRVIGMRRWPFLEVDGSTALECVIGQRAYDLTDIPDLLHVDAVRAELGTEYIELKHKGQQDFRTLEHSWRDHGQPEFWTRIGNRLLIWRRPDAAYTLVVDYVKDPPDLASDEDQTALPAAYQDVLVWGAIAELCFRERDAEGFAMAKGEYGTRIIDMMNEYGVRQRQNSSHVKQSGTWDHLNIENDSFAWQA